jgi:hypothetical protein
MELAMGSAVMQTTARRVMVRRADAVGVPSMSIDERMPHLVHLLERWSVWCEAFRVNLGYRRRVPGLISGDSHEARQADQADANANRISELVDTAVGDLPDDQRLAINLRYGMMASVVRSPRDDYAKRLAAAHESLLCMLPKKGVDI